MSTSPFEIPGYQLLEKLGEGSTAVVWKARQISLDRIVAIKTLMPEWRQDADAMAGFRKEAMAAARLKHSGIIQVIDAGETADAVYFVMEYVEGSTLADRIHQHGPLDESAALNVALSVAAALNYAWETAKMIHCDIKPDNIMIDHDGTVKVADLGLARALGPTATTGVDEFIVGTPNYISPEQARGEAQLDCGTDVYALGATLYHMVTGRLPFGDTPGTAPLQRQQTDFLLDPLDLNPNLTPALGALIEQMMIKDRPLRPAVWEQVIADLQEVREGYLPAGDFPSAGASTVLRGAWRTANPGQHRPGVARSQTSPAPSVTTPKKKILKISAQPAVPRLRRRSRNWVAIVSAVVLLMVAIYAGLYLYLNFSGKLPARVETSVFAPVHKVYGYLRGLTPAISPTSGETDVALADLEAHLLHPATEQTAAALPGRQPVTNLVSIPRQSPVMIHAIKRGPHSALYLRAARFHDFEIDTYRQYNGRMSIPVVNLIEQACRQAIRDFKTCREAQLNQQSVEPYIQQCYQALADAQLSAKVPNQAGVAANSLPALPSLELPPEASNTPASTATAPTVAP